jgi:hypothetical protein
MEANMQRGWIIAPALLALAASGSQLEAQSATPVKGIYALNDCAYTPTDSNTKGTVNIIVPKNISSAKIVRRGIVNYGPRIKPDNKLTGDAPPFKPNNMNAAQPFDVFLQDTGFDPSQTGFILLRVISRKNDKWTFFDRDGIHGVAANQPSGNAICGRFTPVSGENGGGQDAGQIAYFYIDIAQFRSGGAVPFSIILQEDGQQYDASQVPIIIDPAIHGWSS